LRLAWRLKSVARTSREIASHHFTEERLTAASFGPDIQAQDLLISAPPFPLGIHVHPLAE
jgi:hypothetical protein